MGRGELIAQFLNNLRPRNSAQGSEGQAFFIRDKNGNKYVLKKYWDLNPYKGKADFLSSMSRLKVAVDCAIADGVKAPQIYDYDVIKEGRKERYVKLEQKMPGMPFYIVKEENLPGKEAKELRIAYDRARDKGDFKEAVYLQDEMAEKRIEYNLTRQEQILSSSQSTIDRLVEQLALLEIKNQRIEVDPFPENLLYDHENQQFSFIDLADRREGDWKLDGSDVTWRAISFTSVNNRNLWLCSHEDEANKMFRNEALIQKRVLDSLEAHDLLYVRSEGSKQGILSTLGPVCNLETLEYFDKKAFVRK